jgi:hypothetical protein
MAGSALGAFWSAVVSGPYGGDRSITWVGGWAGGRSSRAC